MSEDLLDGALGDPWRAQLVEAVDDVTETVVQAQLALGDQPEHRHRHERLGGAVQRREGVAGERLLQVRRADRRVEHALPVGDDDDLRRGVEEPLVGLLGEAFDELLERLGHDPLGHGLLGHGPLAGAAVGHAVDGTAPWVGTVDGNRRLRRSAQAPACSASRARATAETWISSVPA